MNIYDFLNANPKKGFPPVAGAKHEVKKGDLFYSNGKARIATRSGCFKPYLKIVQEPINCNIGPKDQSNVNRGRKQGDPNLCGPRNQTRCENKMRKLIEMRKDPNVGEIERAYYTIAQYKYNKYRNEKVPYKSIPINYRDKNREIIPIPNNQLNNNQPSNNIAQSNNINNRSNNFPPPNNSINDIKFGKRPNSKSISRITNSKKNVITLNKSINENNIFDKTVNDDDVWEGFLDL